MKIKQIDHLVLTVKDIGASLRWYSDILGMRCFQNGSRWEAHFGNQKINFHVRPGEFQPAAGKPAEGSADLCFEIEGSIAEAEQSLQAKGVSIILGPVERMGARGTMASLYLRDPDGNLIELSQYQ